MAIWVSKDVSGPQECRPMLLNNLWIGLTAKKVKMITFENFPCIFSNFLCIIKLLSAKWIFITFDCLWCYSIPYSPYTNKRAGLKIRMTFLKFWATLVCACACVSLYKIQMNEFLNTCLCTVSD